MSKEIENLGIEKSKEFFESRFISINELYETFINLEGMQEINDAITFLEGEINLFRIFFRNINNPIEYKNSVDFLKKEFTLRLEIIQILKSKKRKI